MHFLDTRAVSFIVFFYSFLSSVLTQFLWFCLHREVYLIGGLIHKSVGFTKQIWMHVCHGHHLASSGTFLYECFALKWSKTTLHQPNKMWILVVFFIISMLRCVQKMDSVIFIFWNQNWEQPGEPQRATQSYQLEASKPGCVWGTQVFAGNRWNAGGKADLNEIVLKEILEKGNASEGRADVGLCVPVQTVIRLKDLSTHGSGV